MATQYTLVCQNNSSMAGSFCVFQGTPGNSSCAVLAWLCKFCHPGVSTKFIWSDQPCFVWCQAKSLDPGCVLYTSQAAAADVQTNNSIGFSKQGGGLLFTPTAQKADDKHLLIVCDAAVPHFEAAIGIGKKAQAMCGTSQYVAMASPNMSFSFAPADRYYITFGSYEAGRVLDLNSMRYAQIPLSREHPSYVATFMQDNTWSFELPKEKLTN